MSRVPFTSTTAESSRGHAVLRMPATAADQQAEWFGQARRGDRAAFARLVQQLQDRLYNAVSRMVPQADDALEVTQETFTRALASIGEFRGESQPYTWLFRIAMNLAISRRRKETVRKASSLEAERGSGGDDQMSSLREQLASGGLSPLEAALKRETLERVRVALARQSDTDRALLVMRDIDGMDYAEMAKVLDVPLGTLKSRLFRARMALRSTIESMETKR
jgi:RNA polymerase sigma-70 factor, ECF subfamily